MSVQQLVTGLSEAPSLVAGQGPTLSPAQGPLAETCRVLLLFVFLLCVTLLLLASTTFIDRLVQWLTGQP